jgi:hypothetical protein
VRRHQDIAAELNCSISTVARSLDEQAERSYIARGRERSVRGGPSRIRVTKRPRSGRAGSRVSADDEGTGVGLVRPVLCASRETDRIGGRVNQYR